MEVLGGVKAEEEEEKHTLYDIISSPRPASMSFFAALQLRSHLPSPMDNINASRSLTGACSIAPSSPPSACSSGCS